MLSTPVVFLIYRRPDLTQQVFNEIVKAKPKQLFVVADGPKNPEDMPRCQATRAIIEQVNWDCEVKTNYADQNMGLRKRISSGLNWVFDQVEQAIILEDDCVPHPTFFQFCEELLEKYKDDDRVMHISGDNFGYKRPTGVEDSYYFSIFAHVWGWATWRRAWAKYDVNMTTWQDDKIRNEVLSTLSTVSQQRHWRYIWDATFSEKIATWAYQWMYTCVLHKSFCIMPYDNQITNIGIGAEGTNTKNTRSPLVNLTTSDMLFPLKHPTAKQFEADGILQAVKMFSLERPILPIRILKKTLNKLKKALL